MRRPRAIALGAILVLLVALLLWRCERRPRDGGRAAAPATTEPARDDAPVDVRRASPPPEGGEGPGKAPIIDEIIVEKDTVCEGEENLVTVRAHTPDPADEPYLHYMIVDSPGASVPLRLNQWSPESGAVDRKIMVFGRDNVVTTVDLPDYRIEKCMPSRQLVVTRGLQPNTDGEFWFSARVVDLLAEKPLAEPVTYRWTFGDGTTAETELPYVVHDFAERPQDALYAQILVTAEAIAKDGEKVVGRTSLQLYNPVFEHLESRGVVLLLVKLDPRFPVKGADGVVRQGVKLWHWHPTPVTITSIRALRALDGGGEKNTTVEPATLLGTRTIPPEGITFSATLDTRTEPDVFTLNYYLEGTTDDGRRVHGSFSVMNPPAAPTRENTEPVRSAYQRAKIVRAMEVLGRKVVYDEDLIRLEKQGYFDDLREEDFPPPEPAPEPTRPGL